MIFRNFLLLILSLCSFFVQANVYSIPADGSRLIGSIKTYKVQKGDYFKTIADHYNIGILELMDANPGVDPFLPTVGTKLTIPTQMLLPNVPHRGIVINLPELRLYYFPKKSQQVYVFPVGIGRIGRETPKMITKIKMRIANPSWTPPASIRAEHLKESGEVLPTVVPAGPDNPLGNYAMQLAYSDGSYLIHGTNKDFGIGMRVSAGCIRLNPADIKWLFAHSRAGDSVRIINQTVKTSVEPNGNHIIEVHSPLSKAGDDKAKQVASLDEKVVKFIDQKTVNSTKANDALLAQNGIPMNIAVN